AAELYEGTVSGSLSANAQNQFATKVGFKRVSMGHLTRALSGSDGLSGKGTGNIDLKTAGATEGELAAGLTGAAEIQVREGAIRGIDLNQTLARLGGVLNSVLDGTAPDLKTGFDLGNRTAFDVLDGAVAINQGVADVKKLDFRTPLLRVTQGKPAQIYL